MELIWQEKMATSKAMKKTHIQNKLYQNIQRVYLHFHHTQLKCTFLHVCNTVFVDVRRTLYVYTCV